MCTTFRIAFVFTSADLDYNTEGVIYHHRLQSTDSQIWLATLWLNKSYLASPGDHNTTKRSSLFLYVRTTFCSDVKNQSRLCWSLPRRLEGKFQDTKSQQQERICYAVQGRARLMCPMMLRSFREKVTVSSTSGWRFLNHNFLTFWWKFCDV